jgi:vacuolar-type H+-ATPase subunit I/STV1
MTEKELIKNFRQLRKEIRPSSSFVLETKRKIFGENPSSSFLSLPRVSFALVFSFLLIFAIFKTRFSLPGSPFYPLKKAVQYVYFSILPEKERAKAGLVLTEEKLKELERVVQENSVKNLPSTLKEYSQTKSQAQKEIAKVLPETKNPAKKEIISKLTEIQEKEKRVFATLQILPEEISERERADKELVAILLEELKKRDLKDESFLKEAEELYFAGKYNLALEKILIYLQNNENNGSENQ